MTKLLGVIGDPIAHSLSPLIHNGWLRDLGYDATYEALHVRAGEFDPALKTLSSRNVLGLNVTLPHKQAALAAASEVSEAARKIGAANTLTYLGADKWRADNTDAPGFLTALGSTDPHTDEIVVLGAGGSARALIYALSKTKHRVKILNRTVARAQALAQEFGGVQSEYGSIDHYKEYIDSAAIVINTTSMGHDGHILSLPSGADRLFFDISYGKISAPQLLHAQERGWRTMDGLSMLVAQAAFSFQIWFGEMPDIRSGMRRCQSALEAVS
ncbi:MAG: shikimate dehydrogenase [Hyphomonadaceae bacterium]|nr:shikimate dehydrogenase [Hyphomonadaceae bacterium]